MSVASLETPIRPLFIRCTELPYPADGCRKCRSTGGWLARFLRANGTTAIRWVCGNLDEAFERSVA